MRVALLLVTSALASRPSFQAGAAVGEALSNGVDQQAFESQVMGPQHHNAQVEAAMGSFLQRPVVNLHVQETPGVDSFNAAEAKEAAELLRLEQGAVGLEEQMTGALSKRSFLKVPEIASELQRTGASGASLADSISQATALVNAGGVAARRGLAMLLQLSGEPNARTLITPKTATDVAKLAARESTPDSTRELCGSVITRITGLPVAFQSSDVRTGAFGHTTIVAPRPSRVYTSFAQQAPFDLPRELFTDVNKGAAPVVNLIVDRASFLGAPVLSGIEAELRSMYPNEAPSGIKAAISAALATAAEDEGVDAEELSCARNYSGCPAGWANTGSGCLAPFSYSGTCSGAMDFSGTPVEKATLAKQCDAKFPCM